MKPFIYNGMRLTPLRELTQSEVNQGLKLPFTSIGVSNYQNVPHLNRQTDIPYNYINFYVKAKLAGAENIDVFLYKGMEVVPCTNELFKIK